eukprot:3469809-Amphidinium_carterae.1
MGGSAARTRCGLQADAHTHAQYLRAGPSSFQGRQSNNTKGHHAPHLVSTSPKIVESDIFVQLRVAWKFWTKVVLYVGVAINRQCNAHFMFID